MAIKTAYTAVAALFIGLLVALVGPAPANASYGDNRPRVCTTKEYRAIKNNMTHRQVMRILDGPGKNVYEYRAGAWSDMERYWGRGGRYSGASRTCEVWFDKDYAGGPWRVYYKSWDGRYRSMSRYFG
jgi:hypothetical protein